MTEYKEKVQAVIDEYPELGEISDEAFQALGLAMGVEAAEEMMRAIEQEEKKLDAMLDNEGSEGE